MSIVFADVQLSDLSRGATCTIRAYRIFPFEIDAA